MENVINRITSFELINYIFIGGLFLLLGYYFELPFFTKLIDEINKLGTALQIALYITAVYFLGVLVSRIGRVLQSIIENWKNKKSILYIKFVPESDYIKAEKIDPKIQIISMESHFNRSLVGLFLTFTIIYTLDKVFLIINDSAPSMANYLLSLFIIFILLTLLALFYYSWKRQEAHVRTRVENVILNEDHTV